jgi:hypothetical protein
MFNWLRELRDILREPRPCSACDVLKIENANLRRQNEILLNRIAAPQVQEERMVAPEPVPLPRKHIPWRVKQQELERADKPEHDRILAEFEKKIKAAEAEAESKHGAANAGTETTAKEA